MRAPLNGVLYNACTIKWSNDPRGEVPAGSARAQSATLASRISIQRQTLLIMFSAWLRTVLWMRGDDAFREAYNYPGGHPLPLLVIAPLCCYVLLGRASPNSVFLMLPQVSMLLVGEHPGTNLLWNAASDTHFVMNLDSAWLVFLAAVVTTIAVARLPRYFRIGRTKFGGVVPEEPQGVLVEVAWRISVTEWTRPAAGHD